MILATLTMAESRPAFTHSSRKTLFSTTRAAGLSPKLTFETPSVVRTRGCLAFNSRIASMVAKPSRRVSSAPVAIGNVRVSTKMSPSSIPHCLVNVSISRSATRTFHSAVRAWPCSSIVNATTAAPCSATSGITRWKREPGPSPSSKLTELMMARPGRWFRPASMTSGSVESSITGRVTALPNREASCVMSATPSRPT